MSQLPETPDQLHMQLTKLDLLLSPSLGSI